MANSTRSDFTMYRKPRLGTIDISYAAHGVTAGAIEKLLVDYDVTIPGLASDVDGSVIYAVRDDVLKCTGLVDERARRPLCTGHWCSRQDAMGSSSTPL